MSDQKGRCTNVEFCTVAVSQKIVTTAEGEPFICPKCSEPLQALSVTRTKSRRAVAIALQAAVLVIGGGVIAWKLTGSRPETLAPFAAAASTPAASSEVSNIVSGSSFTSAPPPPVVAAAAPPAPTPVVAPPPISVATAPPPEPPRPAPPPAAVLLRLSGSDAVVNGLGRRLASGYLSLIGDTGITAEPAGADTAVIGSQAGSREGINLAATSSSSGLAALLRGNADVAVTTRRITPAETERLAPLGDLTSPANEHVVGVQGVAVIVSPANRIPSLTTSQLRDVVGGRVTDWAALGGQPGPIHLHAVDDGGGRIDTPHDILFGPGDAAALPTGTSLDSSEAAAAAAVAGDRGAIALVTTGAAGTARIVPVSETGTAPVMPTDLAVATEDYPLTRRIYFYNAGGAIGGATGGYVRRFSDYIASPTGQAAVEAAGLVSLSLRTELAALPDTASDRFKQFVAGTSRVSVEFRFQPGLTELDNRSARDVERLVAFVKARRLNPARLVLAAFADNSGAPAANQATSQRRADAVAAALARQGLQPGRIGAFGADYPVADNATLDGRERNRRVEVYLAP